MKRKNRLSQEAWLALALETLAGEGKAQVEIDHLAAKLGVTKGSFYSHFRDKQHFIHSIAIYWAESSTLSAIEQLVQSQETGEEKLRSLMQIIRENELEKYDLVMRAWALDEPMVAEQVAKVDMLRYEFVRGLFSEMGFAGDELEMRTMLFQVYHSGSHSLKGKFFEENRLKHEELRHRLFTQPTAKQKS
jgi:AcrR family transcriptional regulator